MPVEWEATFRALEAMAGRVARADRRIEMDGAKLVQTAMALRAPRRSGALAGDIKIGRYKGFVSVGPTGPYGRRTSIGYHGRDVRGRDYEHKGQRGNPYAYTADRDAAPLVRELGLRHWLDAIRGTNG